MVKDYTSFKNGELLIEVNYNDAVTPCKKIKFTLHGKEQVIDREDLYAMMMLFGNEDQQTDLIPVTHTQVRVIKRLLKVRAKKDMKKGEIIAFPFQYYVPEVVYEKLLMSKPHEFTSGDLSTNKLEKDLLKKK